MSDISSWNIAAASNNSLSPNGFPENMLPSGVNDAAREVMAAVRRWYEDAQWIDIGHVPTFVSATSFTIPTDVTATYEANRRIKMYGTTMGTFYGTISSSSYAAPNTTVNVTMDSGALTSNLSRVYISALTPTNSAIPAAAAPLLGTATFSSAGVMTAGTVPLARIQRTEASGKNAGAVTLTSSETTITTADLGTVNTGDRILISAAVVGAIKGGTAGSIAIYVGSSSGTATIAAYNDKDRLYGPLVTVAAVNTYNGNVSGILNVTSGGTLVVKLYGASAGSDSSILAGQGQIHAIVLNNG